MDRPKTAIARLVFEELLVIASADEHALAILIGGPTFIEFAESLDLAGKESLNPAGLRARPRVEFGNFDTPHAGERDRGILVQEADR